MPQGLQVFNADGSLNLTLNQRTGRVLGSIVTGTNNGVHGDGNLSTGKPFYVVVANDAIGQYFDIYAPGISFSGNTMTWVFDASVPAAQRRSVTIVYGVA